jgi:hypothetical protein
MLGIFSSIVICRWQTLSRGESQFDECVLDVLNLILNSLVLDGINKVTS